MNKQQPNSMPSNRHIQSYVFGAILVLLFIVVCRLFYPFYTPLLWAILLYILISPLYRRLIKNINFDTFKGKMLRNFWAGVFTLGTMIIVFIPFSVIGTLFFRQIMELGTYVRDLLREQPEYLQELFEKTSMLINDISSGQVTVTADSIIHQINAFIINEMQRAAQLGTNIIKGVGGILIYMFVMVFSLFFFYMDGPYLSQLVLRAIPIKSEYISALTKKFQDITRNLFFGYIVVALLQSTVAFIIYSIFGVKGSLVLSVLTFLLVFIPILGATIIYVPLTIMMLMRGDIAIGIIFFIISAIFISGIDNILRPIFLKDRIKLHPLIIFFAILGGLAVFGFNGLILGPVLVIFFLTVLDLFLIEHKIDR